MVPQVFSNAVSSITYKAPYEVDHGEGSANITVKPPHPPVHSNEPNTFSSRCALYILAGVKSAVVFCGADIFLYELWGQYINQPVCSINCFDGKSAVVFCLDFEANMFLSELWGRYICTSWCALYIVLRGNLLLPFVRSIHFCLNFEANIFVPAGVLVILFPRKICCCFLSRLCCRQYLKMGYWELLCWK